MGSPLPERGQATGTSGICGTHRCPPPSYQAFVPDPIGALQLSIASSVAASISAAERAIDTRNRDPPRLASLEVLERPRTSLRAAGDPRRRSSVEAFIVALPAHPVITVATVQKLLDRSKQQSAESKQNASARRRSARRMVPTEPPSGWLLRPAGPVRGRQARGLTGQRLVITRKGRHGGCEWPGRTPI